MPPTIDRHERFGLAPMEGVTDFAFRLWISLCGAPDFAWTPFLRFTDTFPFKIPELFVPELDFPGRITPFKVIPQLMGPEVKDFIRVAEMLLPKCEFVDLNCGCPSPTVTGNGSGSSLLKTVERFYGYVEKAVQELGPNRVSVKMRTGYNSEEECVTLVTAIAALPLAQLTIHGRSRVDRYKGKANWRLIYDMSQK